MGIARAGFLAVAVVAASGCALVAGYEPLRESTPEFGDAGALDAAGTFDAAALPGAGGEGNVSPQGADAGPFTPAQLGAGLVVWLDGQRGVTLADGKVISWADQSGHGNDAVQSAVAMRPSLHGGAVAQKDAIAFDGVASGLRIGDAASLQWGLDDYAIEIVAAYTNAPTTSDVDGYGALWTKGAAKYPYPGAALFANSVADGASAQLLSQVKTPEDAPKGWVNSSAQGLNDGKFHVFATRRVAGLALEARVDGAVTSAKIAPVDVSSAGQAAWIGSSAVGQQLLRGDIAEVVVHRGPLADADVAALEEYLRVKYAL